MYVANLIWSAILLIPGTSIFIYRVFYKKQPIFDRVPFTYFMRPRPIESMLLFGLLFNLLRLINMAILITDVVPNPIFRGFFYELPWQVGLCALACYVFGIAHTVSRSNRIIKIGNFFTSLKVDIVYTCLISFPFVTNNICSVAAAIYAEKKEFLKFRIFTSILYYLWTIYCLVLAASTLYFGLGLLYILKFHLKNQAGQHESVIAKVKHAMFKVKMILYNIIICLVVFAVIKCLYGTFRQEILKNKTYSLLMAAFWTFDGTIASAFVVIILLVNPKAVTPFNYSSASESSESLQPSLDKYESIHINESITGFHKTRSTFTHADYEEQQNYYNLVTENARHKSLQKNRKGSYSNSQSSEQPAQPIYY
ncbi:hypothetical protein CU097_002904 [Rhizopus azygosporus]|uniref:G-protein coupled receptors family 1 profile domain-containing protein n=1 Tax=Rhizopus azygosporus TaxID=86630 RepID=A0A367JI88_RHIAZ|nr:hypothetical protein CU097_002904 [Rhizopus azygosporus]